MKRVLVCDDEPHILRLLQLNLQREGYDVVAVRDGREAKESLAGGGFDLAVLDLVMPHADGIEVVDYLRNELGSTIPVVIMTQSCLEGLEEQVAGFGAVTVSTQDGKVDWSSLMCA